VRELREGTGRRVQGRRPCGRRKADQVSPSAVFDDLRITAVDSSCIVEGIYHGIHDSDCNSTNLFGEWMAFEFVVE
jgi:hypothetical protein